MARGVFVASTPLTVFNLNDVFDKPRCSLYFEEDTSIANNTSTLLAFDSEMFDIGGLHSTASNTGRITIPTGAAGVYLLQASIGWASTAGGGVRRVTLKLNGTTDLSVSNQLAMTSQNNYNRVCAVASLAVGDFVEVYVLQTSGGAIDAEGDSTIEYINQFSAMWLRPTP